MFPWISARPRSPKTRCTPWRSSRPASCAGSRLVPSHGMATTTPVREQSGYQLNKKAFCCIKSRYTVVRAMHWPSLRWCTLTHRSRSLAPAALARPGLHWPWRTRTESGFLTACVVGRVGDVERWRAGRRSNRPGTRPACPRQTGRTRSGGRVAAKPDRTAGSRQLRAPAGRGGRVCSHPLSWRRAGRHAPRGRQRVVEVRDKKKDEIAATQAQHGFTRILEALGMPSHWHCERLRQH